MLAIECASILTRRLSLLNQPIDDGERLALTDTLQQAGHRCPSPVRNAIPSAVQQLLDRAEKRREDHLLGVWSLAADESRAANGGPESLWLAQLSRQVVSRAAAQALLGLDRKAMLGLIGSDPVLAAERKQRTLGFSDNHLHSGAADELGALLDRLVPRVTEIDAPRGLEKAVGPNSSGQRLNAGPVVLALAAACMVLATPSDPDDADLALLNGKAWWAEIRRLAEQAGKIEAEAFASRRDPIQMLSMKTSGAAQLSELYRALREVADGAQLSTQRLTAARRGLIALAVLHDLVSVPPGSSLGTFVLRFDLMRSIRTLFGEDKGRLASALKTMYVHAGVTQAELRKSIVADPKPTIEVDGLAGRIKADIREHAGAARDLCSLVDDDEVTVRMPVTFTRRNHGEIDPWIYDADFKLFREPIGETMAVGDAIVQATADETLSRFVAAVDLVGDEKNGGAWVYALAYKRIASASTPPLEFTCHAGEYFADHTEGIRRVGELALFMPARVRRIGHCLSLGIDADENSHDCPDAAVVLENLIWLALVLDGDSRLGLGQADQVVAPHELRRELRLLALQLAPYVFGTEDLGVADLIDWYLKRFDPEAMKRWIPGLEVDASETHNWPCGIDLWRLRTPSCFVDAMLMASVYRGGVEVKVEDGFRQIRFNPTAEVPSDLLDQAQVAAAKAEPIARDAVRTWITREEIVIESCPSSNAALIDLSLDRHPIWSFHQRNLLCSVNTDDPALFGAALNEEYVHAGMVADGDGGDGAAFLKFCAEVGRGAGAIQRPLCAAGETPADTYRAILALVGES